MHIFSFIYGLRYDPIDFHPMVITWLCVLSSWLQEMCIFHWMWCSLLQASWWQFLILVFYYYCICIYYSNNMTALVAFPVSNNVHTKIGVYGWTGLELYAFKIKMGCCVVLMCRFWNCLHWDKSKVIRSCLHCIAYYKTQVFP